MQANYFTSSCSQTEIDVVNKLACGTGDAAIVCTGCVNVTSRVHGWRQHWPGKVIDMGPIKLPPLQFSTRAFWLDIPIGIIDTFASKIDKFPLRKKCCHDELQTSKSQSCANDDYHDDDLRSEVCKDEENSDSKLVKDDEAILASSIHGLNHILVAIAPLFVICEHEDIETEHFHSYKGSHISRLMIYGKLVPCSCLVLCFSDLFQRLRFFNHDCVS